MWDVLQKPQNKANGVPSSSSRRRSSSHQKRRQNSDERRSLKSLSAQTYKSGAMSSEDKSSRSDQAHVSHESQRDRLRQVCEDTLNTLPGILAVLGTQAKASYSEKFSPRNTRRLDPLPKPFFSQPAIIKVVNGDTLNCAQEMAEEAARESNRPGEVPRPLVLNFANAQSPGGGWRNGALAQEEAICYRSSLALALDQSHYPLRKNEGLYSPYVLVIRSDMGSGHHIYNRPPQHFPIVSALTIAALRKPRVQTYKIPIITNAVKGTQAPGSNPPSYSTPVQGIYEKKVFAYDEDRDLTKSKMRLGLRIAASREHRCLLLGAFGCGVYGNPPEDVARCWLEVLREDEFSGNRWRAVWFAVYDTKTEGNFEHFHRILHGQPV